MKLNQAIQFKFRLILKSVLCVTLLLASALAVFLPATIAAPGWNITVSTDKANYQSDQLVIITGTVTNASAPQQ